MFLSDKWANANPDSNRHQASISAILFWWNSARAPFHKNSQLLCWGNNSGSLPHPRFLPRRRSQEILDVAVMLSVMSNTKIHVTAFEAIHEFFIFPMRSSSCNRNDTFVIHGNAETSIWLPLAHNNQSGRTLRRCSSQQARSPFRFLMGLPPEANGSSGSIFRFCGHSCAPLFNSRRYSVCTICGSSLASTLEQAAHLHC